MITGLKKKLAGVFPGSPGINLAQVSIWRRSGDLRQ